MTQREIQNNIYQFPLLFLIRMKLVYSERKAFLQYTKSYQQSKINLHLLFKITTRHKIWKS